MPKATTDRTVDKGSGIDVMILSCAQQVERALDEWRRVSTNR